MQVAEAWAVWTREHAAPDLLRTIAPARPHAQVQTLPLLFMDMQDVVRAPPGALSGAMGGNSCSLSCQLTTGAAVEARVASVAATVGTHSAPAT